MLDGMPVRHSGAASIAGGEVHDGLVNKRQGWTLVVFVHRSRPKGWLLGTGGDLNGDGTA